MSVAYGKQNTRFKRLSLDKSFFYALNEEEIKQVRKFVKESYQYANSKVYYSQEERPKKRVLENLSMGKAGEVALSRLLKEKFNKHTEIDFNIYEDRKGDEQDFEVNGLLIESKCCKTISNYLLVSVDDVKNKEQKGKKPDIIVLSFVKWDVENKTILPEVYVYGFCTIESLTNGPILKPGDFIPGTNKPVHNHIYYMEYQKLETNWNKLGELLAIGGNK